MEITGGKLVRFWVLYLSTWPCLLTMPVLPAYADLHLQLYARVQHDPAACHFNPHVHLNCKFICRSHNGFTTALLMCFCFLQIGDVLLASAFVSYAGPFNMLLRNQLVEEKWRPDLIQRNIPLSEGIKPLDLLTDDTKRAKWANEGLPIDPLSVENGAIMTNASRWPLMIDPQLQVGARRWLQCTAALKCQPKAQAVTAASFPCSTTITHNPAHCHLVVLCLLYQMWL